jgi:hypothetical protein
MQGAFGRLHMSCSPRNNLLHSNGAFAHECTPTCSDSSPHGTTNTLSSFACCYSDCCWFGFTASCTTTTLARCSTGSGSSSCLLPLTAIGMCDCPLYAPNVLSMPHPNWPRLSASMKRRIMFELSQALRSATHIRAIAIATSGSVRLASGMPCYRLDLPLGEAKCARIQCLHKSAE